MTGLTEGELQVLTTLANARNRFLRLPRCHPAEEAEFNSIMHRLQDLVMMRAAVRAHPDVFRSEPEFE